MEHSGRQPPSRRQRLLVAGVALAELCARLAIPAGLWGIAAGAPRGAAIVAAIAVVATIARGVVTSLAVQTSVAATWRAVIRAAERLAMQDLRAERKIGLLAEATREVAVYEATIVPLRAAYGIALALALAFAGRLVGPFWVAVAGAAALPAVLALAWSARRIRRVEQASWDAFGAVSTELRVLVEACVELRAHDREAAFAAALREKVDALAMAERRTRLWTAAGSSLPAAALLLAAVTPFAERITAAIAAITGHRAAEVAVVGGACVYFLSGFGRLWALAARDAPFRNTLGEFLALADVGSGHVRADGAARETAARDAAQGAAARETAARDAAQGAAARETAAPAVAIDLGSKAIRFRDATCAFPGAAAATPAAVTHTWAPGAGLALVGPNGAGKTTLALALLGLIPLRSGAIEIGGARMEADAAMASALRGRAAFLSQTPFLEPGASVGWHLHLFADPPLDDARIAAALVEVGLDRVLRDRNPDAPLDVPAGQLSGGEQRRMFLARALAHDADLFVLDEPEAGLDHAARTHLRDVVDRLAKDRRVLLIAHDPAVIPASFARLAIDRGPL